MKRMRFLLGVLALCLSVTAFAAADLKVDTPAVNALKQSMRDRFHELRPYLDSGAVGLAAGQLALRNANAVPLAARQQVSALVAAQNRDLNALYAEIARANGHPEWAGEIRDTFAQRWIQHAHPGWWVQSGGRWVQK
jgi:uncharacterized protein